ncbi:hypothetical protein FANTH_6310 [Fusarium anthophilum]|uniref:F-box domain-containing protein n=1 Tax=Fusarium anthophilum TaxID=48485 RepID=A0A8H5E5R6_9HYPO|nr:hypothetical protein FANTH_6310 [Fusarium anthophilum]
MSYLANLSPELCRSIAAYLHLSHILELCATSKSCHAKFEPELYRDIRWTYFHSQKATSKPIHQLLSKILRRPQISGWVQKFAVNETGFGPKPRVGNVFSSAELTLLRSLLDDTSIPDIDGWIDELREGSLETIIATILSQLREVRSLTLDVFFRHDDDCAYLTDEQSRISQLFEQSVLAPEGLPINRFLHLKDLSWPSEAFPGPHCFLRRSELPTVMPAMFLPAIESAALKVDQPGTTQHDIFDRIQEVAQSSRLEVLKLRHSSINDRTLARILTFTPALKILDIEFDRDMSCLDDTAAPGFHGTSLQASLATCLSSLESLRILCHINDPLLEVPWSSFFTCPLGSLAAFEHLVNLEISLTLLLGSDKISSERLAEALPQSLMHLGIREDGYGVASVDTTNEAIRDFPAQADPMMPFLKTVSVFLDTERWGEERITQMRDIYAPTRFDFTVHHIQWGADGGEFD